MERKGDAVILDGAVGGRGDFKHGPGLGLLLILGCRKFFQTAKATAVCVCLCVQAAVAVAAHVSLRLILRACGCISNLFASAGARVLCASVSAADASRSRPHSSRT